MAGMLAHKIVKVTLSGTMLNGNEEWQTGFHMGNLTQDATPPTQAFADYVRDQWALQFNNADNAISNTYTFNQVKLAYIATDGKYTSLEDVVVSNPAATVTGARAGNPLPPQCALVATLIGGSGKGIAGKGRMYLPGVAQSVDGSGNILINVQTNICANLAGFFNNLNASFDAPGRVVNASKGSKRSLYTDGRNVPVNGVRVGSVYDTQRRRRNGLNEVYVNSVVND